MNTNSRSIRRLAAVVSAAAGLAGTSAALGQSLTTTFAGGNNFAGNTFDLIPQWPITVTSWRTNIDNTTLGAANTITIYTRPGTSAGFGSSSAGWSLFGRDSTVFGAGSGNQSFVGVSGLLLRPGVTTGVYWDLQSYVFPTSSLQYSNGASSDYNSLDLILRSQAGHGNPAFNSTIADRIWNGVVNFVPTASGIQNDTILTSGNGNRGVTFDVIPERDVTLVSLGTSLSTDTNPYAVSVYFRNGTAAGTAGSSVGWTLIGTDPNVIGAGDGVLSRVNVGGVTLRRGQVYGFYVHSVGGGFVNYTDGTASYNRTDIRILSGEGVNSLFSPNGLPRIFNGRLVTTPSGTIRKLLTTMADGNGQDGVMFDVQAGGRAIDVTGFDVNTDDVAGSSPPYRVYFRRSTSVGAEVSSAGWILANTDTLQANGPGNGSALQFGRVTIPAGARYGFFITSDVVADGVNYTDGATSYTNGDITVISNCGKALPFFTGATFFNRIFNGRVQYVVSQCYANCDGSTTAPVLGAADFSCFLTRFRNGDPYANCDLSTAAPVLGAADFSCYLTSFRAGCP